MAMDFIQQTKKSKKADASSLDGLKQKIEELDAAYQDIVKNNASDTSAITPPDYSVDSQFKSYTPESDETLRALAESQVSDYATDNRSKINTDAESKIKSLAEAKESTLRKMQESLSDSDEYYNDARTASSNSALKRGLARSSTAQLTQEAINAAQASTKSTINSEAARAAAQLDQEIAAAQTARDAALGDLDLKTAALLTQKLNALQEERDNKTNEVLEYNNALKERLSKLAMEQDKMKQEYVSKETDRREKENAVKDDNIARAKTQRNEDAFTAVSEYLSGMSAQDARKQLEDPYIKSILSPYHYSTLYNAFNAR